MKKILLLSDTHNAWDLGIEKHVLWADEVWHAGDFGDIRVADSIRKLRPLRGVFGNVDSTLLRAEFPERLRFDCEGLDVLMTHIGGYPGRWEKAVEDILRVTPPKLMVAGHSHILKVMFDKKYDLLYMNPGAAGFYGFHKVRTMLRFVIEEAKVRDLEVVELKK